MTPEQFTYWLQGFTEIYGEQPTPAQWELIKEHLKEVFHKKTPTMAEIMDGLNRQVAPFHPNATPGIHPFNVPGQKNPLPDSPQFIC